ncbi:MAG TPA: glycosyltransferase, partial [Thermoleophilaceae bacterium]|nr:glycosyltransferase [Thermoleophilaceae bacterium]
MRVLIDTSYVGRGPSGTAVYVQQLVRALRAEGIEVVEAAQRRRLAPGGGNPLRSAANAALDQLWLHGGLARAARAAAADVVHHPLPAHSRRIAVPQVVTVHDVAFAG